MNSMGKPAPTPAAQRTGPTPRHCPTRAQVLIISDNYLSERGALSLAAALRKNHSIRELHLKGNGLEDVGVATLCEALMVGLGVGRVWWCGGAAVRRFRIRAGDEPK